MLKITDIFNRLMGAKSRLSRLETLVLESIAKELDGRMASIWQAQIDAINKIQRLPEGIEVDFYRMNKGKPFFDPALSFPNSSPEIFIAEVHLESQEHQKLSAKIWGVKGFLFSIEYDCSPVYFEELTGMDPQVDLKITCTLKADLAASV